MISPQQYRKLMNCYHEESNVTWAAAAAGVDRKTARRYVRGARGPDEEPAERWWRTHRDAFEDVWPEVETWLTREPDLTAKGAFQELCRRYPDRFAAGQMRSFQRRVAAWKRAHGPEPVIVFFQEHRPGERLQLDWFDARELAVRVSGEAFDHLICHVVLPYSNWEWGVWCRSESFASLRRGLQSALWELSRVPTICQTDQSSTATHPRGKGQRGREWNERYLSLLGHYGLRPEKIALQSPEQNGDVESAHRHARVALRDALALRGTREFTGVREYEEFLASVFRERNRHRQPRVEEELARMQPLPSTRLPEWEELNVPVSRESLARVGRHGYSVPARHIGRTLRARIFEDRVEFWDGAEKVWEASAQRGSQGVRVEWRHVVPQLLRRPGAMARWRHRDWLFPSAAWRAIHDALHQRHSGARAEREYLGLLNLALEYGLERVEPLLREDVSLDAARLALAPRTLDQMPELRADLSLYDQLLEVGHG